METMIDVLIASAAIAIGDIKLKIVTMKDGLIEDVQIKELGDQKKNKKDKKDH